MVIGIVLVLVSVALTAFTAHRLLLDGLDGWLLATFRADDTEYAQGYSDRAFREIRPGMSESDVLSLLGKPVGEAWVYRSGTQNEQTALFFSARGELEHVSDESAARSGVSVGMSREDVSRRIGVPMEKNLAYTRSPHGGSYRERVVRIRGNAVTRILHEYYWD